MNAVFNPVAMTGAPSQSGEKKTGVNYYFKSSCEINETLGAPRRLKRSPPAFNRLFNHTRAGSQCGFVLFSRLPAFPELLPQTRAGFPLNIIWASAHQTAPITHLELCSEGGKKHTHHFFLFPPEVLHFGIMPPKSSQRVLFQVKYLPRENRISHPLSLFLSPDPSVFIFFNYFFFFHRASFEGGWHWC